MRARLDPDGFSVEAMVDVAAGAELIVGCRRDPRFGPIVLVGLGGIYAELLARRRRTLAPAGAGELEELLLSLRGAGSAPPGARPGAARRGRRSGGRVSLVAGRSGAIPSSPSSRSTRCSALRDGVVGLDARVVPVCTPRARAPRAAAIGGPDARERYG